MRYLEQAPAAAAAAVVERIWGLEIPSSALAQPAPVLPDGHVELLVHIGTPFRQLDVAGRVLQQARVLVAGQMTTALRLIATPGGCVVGARLRRWAAAMVTGVPQSDIAGGVEELAAVNPVLARRLMEHVGGQPSLDAAMAALEQVLIAWLLDGRGSGPIPSAALIGAMEQMEASAGLVRVETIASRVGVSTRQLERMFAHHVGLSPKQLLRVTRFQQVLTALQAPHGSRWPDLAVRLGYYDQAHFINDFRAITGETPAAWAIDDDSLTAVFTRSSTLRHGLGE